MFGEDLIIGKSMGKMDSKGRIIIPAIYNTEPEDRIIIKTIQDEEDEFALKLYAYEEYFNIIEKLKRLRDNATSLEDFERYSEEIENICKTLSGLVQLDKQRRIQMPNQLLKDIGWSSDDQIQFNGLGNSLLLRRNKK